MIKEFLNGPVNGRVLIVALVCWDLFDFIF